jgi:hypothetical protein
MFQTGALLQIQKQLCECARSGGNAEARHPKRSCTSGGLEAWKSLGLPLSDKFADMEAEVTRLGIEVSPPWQQITSLGSIRAEVQLL